jgi:hypothetical protein
MYARRKDIKQHSYKLKYSKFNLKINIKLMTTPTTEFYETSGCELVNMLEENFEEIQSEFFDCVSTQDYLEWPEHYAYNVGWNVFGLRFFKKDFPIGHLKCPCSASVIKAFDELIVTAGFSILSPGTIIYPHTGITDEVLRCHLGIKIPVGDCAITVGQTTKKWQEGKAFVFDDTILHEAWNRTKDPRIVMLIDVDKKLFFQG